VVFSIRDQQRSKSAGDAAAPPMQSADPTSNRGVAGRVYLRAKYGILGWIPSIFVAMHTSMRGLSCGHAL
jgi:hypothetical protein